MSQKTALQANYAAKQKKLLQRKKEEELALRLEKRIGKGIHLSMHMCVHVHASVCLLEGPLKHAASLAHTLFAFAGITNDLPEAGHHRHKPEAGDLPLRADGASFTSMGVTSRQGSVTSVQPNAAAAITPLTLVEVKPLEEKGPAANKEDTAGTNQVAAAEPEKNPGQAGQTGGTPAKDGGTGVVKRSDSQSSVATYDEMGDLAQYHPFRRAMIQVRHQVLNVPDVNGWRRCRLCFSI